MYGGGRMTGRQTRETNEQTVNKTEGETDTDRQVGSDSGACMGHQGTSEQVCNMVDIIIAYLFVCLSVSPSIYLFVYLSV